MILSASRIVAKVLRALLGRLAPQAALAPVPVPVKTHR